MQSFLGHSYAMEPREATFVPWRHIWLFVKCMHHSLLKRRHTPFYLVILFTQPAALSSKFRSKKSGSLKRSFSPWNLPCSQETIQQLQKLFLNASDRWYQIEIELP